ncbi:Non-canonical purine NTP pyrophosphatase [Chlamydiales bacterium SCGC AB-751-O23]|jgi:XTP/dITP diphosphohydrolase|nr:Non-canonical purine NTP pyrophosphatase [Chlamydiales bacterium SCGC AB-751-O23]
MEIIFASKNNHKVREIKEMIQESFDFPVLSLSVDPKYVQPEETGSTFEENALIKARDAHKHFKDSIVLADDSGLVVPSLKGQPGVYSARYAGENKSDAKNREKLLKEMKDLTGSQRQAYFQCVIVMILPDGEELFFNGISEGSILTQEKGCNGFGYDALFIKHDYDKSFAELNENVKNKISHRRKALNLALLHLEKKHKNLLSKIS